MHKNSDIIKTYTTEVITITERDKSKKTKKVTPDQKSLKINNL